MTMPVRTDRIRRYVVAFCPRCHDDRPLAEVRRLSGYLSQDPAGRVWLVRGCPEHGRIVTLYEQDAEILDHLEQWTAPTKQHIGDTPGNFDPVPACYARGLGEMQNQHTCTFLVDLTDHCNLRCPACFAEAGPSEHAYASLGSVLASLDTRLSREGGAIDVLMLSGGEPTVHPEFGAILTEVIGRNVGRVLVNTNGVELAHDDALLDLVASHRERVEVYLQFDGFRESTHRELRGADLHRIKARAIERLSAAGVFTTLVMTAARGINDDEIGEVIDLAFATPFVGGVSIQPMFTSGRSPGVDPDERLTGTGVLRSLEPQTGGLVTWRDLIALPCSHPHCCSIGYFLRASDGTWQSLVRAIGTDDLKAHLGLVSNRIADHALTVQLDALARDALVGVFREGASLADPVVRKWFATVRHQCGFEMGSILHAIGLPGHAEERLRLEVARRVKRITVKPFMGIDTMIEERLLQCCVHVGTIAGSHHQAVPFCAAQAWPALTASKLPTGS